VVSGTTQTIVLSGGNGNGGGTFICTQIGGNSNTLTCYFLNANGTPTGSTSSIVVAAHASEAAPRLHRLGRARGF